MKYDQENPESGWDSREHFAREIVRLITVFNLIGRDSQGEHIKEKLEALIDLFLTTSGWYEKDAIKIHQEIISIENDHYKKRPGIERQRNIRETEIKIRNLFMEIMNNIKKAGMLMPEKEYYDPIEGIKAQYL